MNKTLYKLLSLLLIAMIFTSCAGNTSKANTKEKVQALVEEFYDGIVKQDKYILTSSSNGEVYSTSIVDGENVKFDYADESFSDLYLFVENGNKYVMYEGDQVYEDSELYDMYLQGIGIDDRTFIDGYLSIDDPETKYEASLKKQNNTKELIINIDSTYEGEEYNAVLTVKAVDDKLISFEHNTKTADQSSNILSEYQYDNVELIIPEHELPVAREYTHIESPYKTIGDIVNKLGVDEIYTTIQENRFYTVDGTLELSAAIPDDIYAALEALDFFDENYKTKMLDLVKDLEIDDCIDFSEYVLDQDDFNNYIGRSVEDLVVDGFEGNGWSTYEDTLIIWLEKDGMVYEANIEIPEDLNVDEMEDFSDLYSATIKDMKFSEVSMAAIPLQ